MVNTAIILAFDDHGIEPVFGIPAVRRLVLLLARLGLSDIHLVGQLDPFSPALSDLLPSRFFHSLEREETVERVVEELGTLRGERVMVLKANHVADRHCLAHLLKYSDQSEICRMKVVPSVTENNDGLYLVDCERLRPLIEALRSHNALDPSVLGTIKEIQSPNGLPCAIQDRSVDTGFSERRLVDALAAQTKADDGFIARHFDRRISQSISRRLAHTSITPNQVTLLGMTMGLIGAFLLSRPGYWPKLIGSLLFVLCVIVDGVDGELARLKLKESNFGHYLDVVTDNIVHVAIFAGIAFGLYHDTGNAVYLRCLWILMGGFALCVVAVYQCILRLDADTLSRSPQLVRVLTLVTNRDFAYLVFALAILERLSWFLLGAAFGSYLFAIVLWFVSFRERRRAG